MAQWLNIGRFKRVRGTQPRATVVYEEGVVLSDDQDPAPELVADGAPLVEYTEEIQQLEQEAIRFRIPMVTRLVAWLVARTVSLLGLDPLHVYVSGLNGSDGNDGRVPERALATIDRAIELYALPGTIRDVVVHVGDGPGYTLTQLTRPRDMLGNLVIIGDGGGQLNEDGFTQHASGQAQAGSDRVTLVTPGGLGVDTFVGYTVEIVTAANPANVGARRLIGAHTDTDVQPVMGFPAALSAGDTWRIVRSSIVTDDLAGMLLFGGEVRSRQFGTGDLPRVYLINLRMEATSTWYSAGAWVLYGVWNHFGQMRDAYLWAGGDTNTADTSTMLVTDTTFVEGLFGLKAQQWISWGLTMENPSSSAFARCSGRLHGLVSLARLSVFFFTRLWVGAGRVIGGSSSFAALTCSSESYMELGAFFAGDLAGAANRMLVTHSGTAATSHGVVANQNARIRGLFLRVELAAGSTANGIMAEGAGAIADLGLGSAFPVVANGAAGLAVRRQGRATMTFSGANIADGTSPPTVNLAAGEGGGQVTAASLAASGNALVGASNDVTPVADGSVISRV